MALLSVSDILSVIDDHGFTDVSVLTKAQFINDTVADICSREPWPFMETDITLAFNGTDAKPSNAPADFRAALSIVNPSNGYVLQPYRLDTAEKQAATMLTDSGDPMLYYFLAGELRVAPIPAATLTLRMRYLRFHPDVDQNTADAGILLPKRHRMAIVYGALVRLYDQEDDPDLSARFEQHYESRLQNMREDLWARQYDRPDVIHVTDPDYYDDIS